MLLFGQLIWDSNEGSTGLFAGYESDEWVWFYDPFADDILGVDLDDVKFLSHKGKLFLGDYMCETEKLFEELVEGKEKELQEYILGIDDLINTNSKYTINE